MRQKYWPFVNFFPRLRRIFILPVHTTNLMDFFSWDIQLFWWFSDNWQKNTSAFRDEKIVRVVKIYFSRVHRNFWNFGGRKCSKLWTFLSMSNTEAQTFGLLTSFFMRGSWYCFLLAHRKVLITESSTEKVIIPFYDFAIVDIEREQLDFLSQLFPLVCQNCNLRDLKPFVENYLLSKKTFPFLSVLSASEIEQKLLAFPQKNWPGLQNRILCAQRKVFLKKKKFL